MKGSILNVKLLTREDKTLLGVKNIGNLKDGDYITININTKFGSFKHNNGKKYKVSIVNHELKILFIEGGKRRINKINKKYADSLISYEWCLAKDDISPQQIFDKHKYGGSKGRSEVAKYCIMDCELCIHLLLQLDLIPNNIGMACVSWDLFRIFLRGQGIKIQSIITKVCSEKRTRIPTLKGFREGQLDDGFEGAIVLEPKPGIYSDDPVSVLDYASLIIIYY